MGNDRDLNRTRRLLMKAALTEFAAKGFAGARTDAIARKAGVDERMIYYCFETKEGLYRGALRSKLAAEVHIGLLAAPTSLPQVTRLVTGMDPEDPKFRRRWSKCLRAIAALLAADGSPTRHRQRKASELHEHVQ